VTVYGGETRRELRNDEERWQMKKYGDFQI
jgi:hypothetical protein